MRNKYLLISLAFILASCNKSNNSVDEKSANNETNSSSISSVENVSSTEIFSSSNSIEESGSSEDSYQYGNEKVIENDDYFYPLVENMAYKDNINLSTSSYEMNANMDLKLDGVSLAKEKKVDYKGFIRFDFEDGREASSESVEHAYDEITFNDNILGVIPADDAKAVNLDYSMFNEGDNIFTVTIGQWYAHKKYDINAVHGGLGGNNATGDDFKIGKVRLELSDGQVIYPYKMVLYKPKGWNVVGYVTQQIIPDNDKYYWLGDGWGNTADTLTYVNHPDPNYDRSFKIDYYFESYTPEKINTYNINTNDYSNGKHTLSLYDGKTLVRQNNVYFDNDMPLIDINIKEDYYYDKAFKVHTSFADKTTGIVNKKIRLDTTTLDNDDFMLQGLAYGKHNILLEASDGAGNYLYKSFDFTLFEGSDSIKIDKVANGNDITFSTDYAASYDFDVYKANVLSTRTNDVTYDENHIPYKFVSVQVSDPTKDVYLSFDGITDGEETIQVSALNGNTGNYDVVYETKNIARFKMNPANYVDNNNTINLKISVKYVGNGSNRLLWASDTQYLPKAAFTDINYMYNALMNYVADEYKNDRMAYFVHTGDIVDDNPSYGASAIAEWEKATVAFKILDDNNVLYGQCAGNHDVGSSLANIKYDYYSTYFGNSRYRNMACYEGNLNDNEAHYDLVTIGGIDFIFLYIGFGIEPRLETIEWANKVLQKYSYRNAILCTHAYINDKGELDTDACGDILYEKYVLPNENVKMVFCGHTDGNALNRKELDNGRILYEVLNCYQFVQTKTYAVSHKISGMDCNGEAFIKSLIFDGNKVSCTTFSPVINATDPLGKTNYGDDKWEIEVDWNTTNRHLEINNLNAYEIFGESIKNIKDETFTITSDGTNYLVVASGNRSDYGFEVL